MTESILPTSCACLKGDYPTAHESLCAKLQQAYTMAEIMAIGTELTDGQISRMIWGLTDLLKAASQQCEKLTAQDFEPVE